MQHGRNFSRDPEARGESVHGVQSSCCLTELLVHVVHCCLCLWLSVLVLLSLCRLFVLFDSRCCHHDLDYSGETFTIPQQFFDTVLLFSFFIFSFSMAPIVPRILSWYDVWATTYHQSYTHVTGICDNHKEFFLAECTLERPQSCIVSPGNRRAGSCAVAGLARRTAASRSPRGYVFPRLTGRFSPSKCSCCRFSQSNRDVRWCLSILPQA